MIFNTDYVNALDEENKKFFDPVSIGIPTHPAKDQLEELKAKIFEGASTVELGFMGADKGSRGQGSATPESYGADERQAMKELARVNKIKLSTHAAPGVTGFAGLGRQQSFDDASREHNIVEIKKAIEFAADVAEGGPVVLHVGEFPRSAYEAEPGKFSSFPDEKSKRVHYLVDNKTGRIIQSIKEDEEIWVPVEERDKSGNKIPLTDADGVALKNEFGENVYSYEHDKDSGNIKVKPVTYRSFADEEIKNGKEESEILKDFFLMQQKGDVEHSLGQAREYEGRYIQGLKVKENLMERYGYFKRLKEIMQNELGTGDKFNDEWTKVKDGHKEEYKGKDPLEALKENINQAQREIDYGREIATSARKQANKAWFTIKNDTMTINEYGLQKTADSFSRLADFAIQQEKEKKLKNPIFIAPESYSPDSYGGHPDEMKKIIIEARKKFVNDYSEKYGEEKAEELAKSHIKATFDIGHAYTWKKYFTGSDKDFHKWIEKKVDDLLEDGIIGHVHISDNFGYDDEHLTPGQGVIGKERLQQFIQKFQNAGIKNVIVEPGGQPGGAGWRAMVGGWDVFGNFNSPVYGAERSSWSQVANSYFGHVNPPQYIFGEYAPSEEFRGSPFWSGLGLE